MSAESTPRIENVSSNTNEVDSSQPMSVNLANQFALATAPLISSKVKLDIKLQPNNFESDFSRVRSLISAGPEAINNEFSIDGLSKHITNSISGGIEKFSIELPNEKPINVNMVMGNGHYNITMSTASREMRQRLNRNKVAMEKTIGSQISSAVKIVVEDQRKQNNQ